MEEFSHSMNSPCNSVCPTRRSRYSNPASPGCTSQVVLLTIFIEPMGPRNVVKEKGYKQIDAWTSLRGERSQGWRPPCCLLLNVACAECITDKISELSFDYDEEYCTRSGKVRRETGLQALSAHFQAFARNRWFYFFFSCVNSNAAEIAVRVNPRFIVVTYLPD